MRKRSSIVGAAAVAAAAVISLWTSGTQAQAPAPAGQAQGGPAAPGGRGGGRGQAPAGPTVDPTTPKKHVLVLGFANGFHHGSISDGVGTIWQLGQESGLFDVEIRSDTTWLTKAGTGFGEARNLDWFDAVVAVNTTGVWQMDDQQKRDFISFIRDDGKGFVGVHAALDGNRNGSWPEYTEMIGGEFWAHPWYVFAAPVIIEDPSFPAMRHFTSQHLTLYDEMYVPRMETFSRANVNVLMRMNEARLPEPGLQEPYASQAAVSAQAAGAVRAGEPAGFMPGTNPAQAGRAGGAPGAPRAGIRPDNDYPIAWAKSYGAGRVFYSSLGHARSAWTNPDVKKMYLEAIKWALGLTEGSTDTHPKRD